MLLTVLSVCLCIFAIAVLVATLTGDGKSKLVTSRLAAFGQAVATHTEAPADIRKSAETLSTIPWLNRWLGKVNLSSAARLYLYQAGVNLTLGALLLTSAAGTAVAGCILYYRLGELVPAALLATLFLPLPFRYVQMKRARRLSLLEQQLPEALSMMSSALRVGHSLAASLGAIAQESPEPIGGEMRKCFEEQNYGVDLRISLTNLTRRIPVQDYRIFVAAVLIQRESGGNLAEILDKVVQTARERFRLRKQVSVHTAQGRMTGWVLSLLPVVIGLAMYLTNPEGMSVLWKRQVGLEMLYSAAVMDVIGALIIRKIVRIRV
jgi:tight adherence protein B